MKWLRNLWRKLTRKRKPTVPKVPAPTKPVHNTAGIERIAVVVGHSKSSGGARLYNGSNEYEFNKKVAHAVLSKARALAMNLDINFNKSVKIFYRDNVGLRGAYKDVGDWGADLSIELHFNAAGVPRARGAEILCINGDTETASRARILLDGLAHSFGSLFRHDKGIKWVEKGERGFYNLNYAKKYGVKYPMLVEPFFGDYETEESKKYVENINLYADEIVDLIIGV